MKKIFALFILSLFFLSPLSVIAQEDNSGSTDTKDNSDSESELKEEIKIDDGRLEIERRERIKDGELEIREKVRERIGDDEFKSEIRREIKGDREKLRALLEEKLRNTPAFERNKILRITEKVEGIESFVDGLSPEEAKKFALLTRARQIEIAKEKKAAELRNIKIMEIKDEEFRVREIVKERIEAAKERFKIAREKRIELKEELKETREQLREVETDEEKLEIAKAHFIKFIDSELVELEALKERIQNNQDIDQEESSESMERIDNAISGLNELKAKIESATTLEELRKIGREIKKHVVVRHVYKTRAVAANICHGILLRSELLERKAELALSKAEESEADTAELNSKIEKLSSLLEEAKLKCKEAKDSFNSAKETDDAEAKKEFTKTFIEKVKEAHSKAREAQLVLVEIRKIVSSLNLKLEEQEVDEIVVEEDENV